MDLGAGEPPREWLAEADGNRTRQTELLGLTGFEDRGAHQDTYASASECITAPEGPGQQAVGARS